MGRKEYIGITLDGDLLKIARVKKRKGSWKVTNLDRISVRKEKDSNRKKNRSKEMAKDYSEDFHFGIDESYDESSSGEGDLGLLMSVQEGGDDEASDAFNADVVTIKDFIDNIGKKKADAAMTIQTGDTNFQVLQDKDYGKLKKKELQSFVEEHLHKVYGKMPASDHYEYTLQDDGSLLLISYKDKPYLLKLLDNVRLLADTKIRLRQMMPDEGLLASVINKNYKLNEEEITCVIHMGFNRSRVFFMQGDQIQHALSPIDEGRGSESVLDVVFSKILFQLDRGEVPGLDRIIITNNDLGEESIEYFREQFPSLEVDEFRYSSDYVDIPEHLEPVAPFFTSAIGSAIAAARVRDKDFREFSMLPEYVQERQNALKLQWHGVILLLLLVATPVVWNNIYQQKRQQIRDLESELFRTEYQIMDLEPVIAKATEFQNLYETELEKSNLLDRLSSGAFYWSETLKTLNDGLGRIKHVWVDRIRYSDEGFMLQGYSTTRNRIPQVTNLFNWADLKAVSVVEMREIKVYRFSIMVYNNFKDDLGKIAESSPTNS